ncbi:hypothetical protein AAMO2058_000806200 [Amorphochlora amoebiformis]
MPTITAMIPLAIFFGLAAAIDNGKGLTPPMGWRSWNLYGDNVSQDLLESIMDAMVVRKRLVNGVPTSLCDLGYCDVGLDDAWQECGSYGKDKYTYHEETGAPVVNTTRFPNMSGMVEHAHNLNLTAGFYYNNCICQDHCGTHVSSNETVTKCYEGDVYAFRSWGFDSVKLDACGDQYDLDVWADLFNQTGEAVMIENCHWGDTKPTKEWCPFNIYRTSVDVRAQYGSILYNLGSVQEYSEKNLSRPGCWAYPDMLEVGCKEGPGGSADVGLTPEETRTHFGAWCIVSSPLVLSHDIYNDTIMDEIWPVISNTDAIMVDQAWHGFSGGVFKSAKDCAVKYKPDGMESVCFPSYQYFYKPINDTTDAVLLLNSEDTTADLTLTFSEIPDAACTKDCTLYDIWTHKSMGVELTSVTMSVSSHDAAFFLVSRN